VKTFLVRLHEDADSKPAAADIPRLCGVIDEVATGLRATFRSERELVAALRAAMGADPPGATGPPRDGGDRGPGARVSSDSMSGSYQVDDGHGSHGPWSAAKSS